MFYIIQDSSLNFFLMNKQKWSVERKSHPDIKLCSLSKKNMIKS